MTQTKKAFSLVELLIVIAIIAILSAIAVPAYQHYILKAKIAAFMPTLDGFINRANTYAGSHAGVLPNMAQLGYTDVGVSGNCLGTTTLNSQFPGVSGLCVQNFALVNNQPCGGSISLTLTAADLPGSLSMLRLRCIYGSINDAATKYCIYTARTTTGSISDLSFSGWISYYSNADREYAEYEAWYTTHNIDSFDAC